MFRTGAASMEEVAAQRPPIVHFWLIALAVMSPTFMVVMASTVVNVALPYIAGNVSASTEEATWALTSYLAANAVMMPVTGWLSRRFGRKRFMLACIVVFSAGSLACGVAHSLSFLIAARVVQGLGGGAMQPLSQAILLESFPVHKRGMAMALYGIGAIFAPIIGPTLGGWIIDHYSWRWVFYINLPVGLASILFVQAFVEDPRHIREARATRVDVVGLILLVLWVASLLVMLDKGQQEDWLDSRLIRTLLVLFVCGLLAFVGWEFHARDPVVDLRILRHSTFATGTAVNTVVGVVLFGCTALLPLFLQTLLGYPALRCGLTMTPRGLGSLVAMLLVGRLMTFVDARLLVAVSFLVLAYSTRALGNLNLEISPAQVVWPNILNGMATGLVFVPLTVMTMSRLRNEEVGNATGIYNLMRNIGSAMGIALVATFLARGAQAHQAAMVSHLTPYDAPCVQHVETLRSALSPQVGASEAAPLAQAIVGAELARQASLWAYMDDFRMLAFLAMVCVPAALLFRSSRRKAET